MTKKNNSYRSLPKRYKEMNEFLLDLIEDEKRSQEELRYLHAFIAYKNLEEEFFCFKENAHEEYDEESPFPTLTL